MQFGPWTRSRYDVQVRGIGQIFDLCVARHALHVGAVRIDKPNRAIEAAGPEVLRNDEADTAGLRTGADERHRLGRQEVLQVADGHLSGLLFH